MKSTEHRRTRHFNIMLVGVVAAALLATLAAIYPSAWASQERHGWHRQHDGGHVAMQFCEGNHASRIDEMGPFVESWLGLDDAQRTAWVKLEREVGRAVATLRESCSARNAATAPDRLALAESMMAAGTAALREIRPAFDAFYATLDDKQQAKLDAEAGQRHR